MLHGIRSDHQHDYYWCCAPTTTRVRCEHGYSATTYWHCILSRTHDRVIADCVCVPQEPVAIDSSIWYYFIAAFNMVLSFPLFSFASISTAHSYLEYNVLLIKLMHKSKRTGPDSLCPILLWQINFRRWSWQYLDISNANIFSLFFVSGKCIMILEADSLASRNKWN